MSRKNIIMLPAGFLIVLLLLSCSKDVQPPLPATPEGCDSMLFSYQRDVKPVVIANCYGTSCHSGGNQNADFRSYHVLADHIRNDALEERLLLPLTDSRHMPYERNMGVCDLYTFRLWIHQGYPNN